MSRPTCWILYDRTDLEINCFFADRLASAGDSLGMDCTVVTTDSVDPYDAPDVVVARTRDHALTSLLEDCGSTVFNRPSVSRVCNDKAATYGLARMLGVPYLPYSLPGDPLPPGPPWVVKSRTGHGGTDVHMAETPCGVDGLCGTVPSPLVQSMAPVRGRDLRVYVLGGRPLCSVMRSSDTDFRANHGLGGRAEVVEPPPEALDIVRRIVPELLPDFVGVDFVFGDGCVYLNEIEDVVGTRMLYELTDLDPATMYMVYIAQSKISR